jgi:2-methylcitrate dehydratase
LCLFEVVLADGARKTYRVEHHRGHYKNPMTDAELEEKFRQMAQHHLPVTRADRLLKLIWGIDKEPRVDNLIAATRLWRLTSSRRPWPTWHPRFQPR